MIHLDLFSGIGGFAIAVEEVWPDARHIFCDNDPYCQAVLKRHWPEAEIWNDIRELIVHTKGNGLFQKEKTYEWGKPKFDNGNEVRTFNKSGCRRVDILTGGFPCQPFSHAGKRRGKSDDRFLWPEMFECIRLFRPEWVVAENVYGLLSIQQGLVFEQVCSDMEKIGYEVWTFIVPACAVNAPHRRDRVWIVGHANGDGFDRREDEVNPAERREQVLGDTKGRHSDVPISAGEGLEREINQAGQGSRFDRKEWQRDWKEVALATCVRGVDDGLPRGVDGISDAKRRQERLKMLGNSIVPQVAVEIMKAIYNTAKKEGT